MDCWDDELFVDAMGDSHPLRCAICQNIMKNAVQCKNQHCFGEGCLKKALERARECPICRERLTLTSLQPATMARSLVDNLLVRCAHRADGCNQHIPLQNKEAHEAACAYRQVACTHSGCQKRMHQKDLADHLMVCEKRVVSCEVCSTAVSATEVRTHSCLGAVTKRLKSMEETVKKLQAELKEERGQREVMHTLLSDLLDSQAKGGGGRGAKALGRSVNSSEVERRVDKQRRERDKRIRPTVADIVRAQDPNQPSEGSLAAVGAGWIAIDEHDHQPYHVHNYMDKSYWYREREVRFVAHPGDVVTRETALHGMPVVRGFHWKWGEQDNGSFGIVVEGESSRGEGWCKVRWNNHLVASYRVGAEKSYDLLVADMRMFSRI